MGKRKDVTKLPEVQGLLDELADILKRRPDLTLEDLDRAGEVKEDVMSKGRQLQGEKKQIGVWVNVALYQETKHQAVDEKISVGALVEKAILEYLERNRKDFDLLRMAGEG